MVWWSTAQWMARLTIRRRPWRSVTSLSLQLESLVFYSSLLASFSSFSTLRKVSIFPPLHLDDGMNLGVVNHFESVKHLNVPTISTTYHSPVLIEEHSKWSDISWRHQPSLSPSSNYPFHPQCRWPSTHMYLMWSDMLKTCMYVYIKNLLSPTINTAYQVLVEQIQT